jgi:hypothetical protein
MDPTGTAVVRTSLADLLVGATGSDVRTLHGTPEEESWVYAGLGEKTPEGRDYRHCSVEFRDGTVIRTTDYLMID